MNFRNSVLPRCIRCRLQVSLCVCALLPSIPTRTRLVLVIHRYEHRKPTNTGLLASECLPNSEVLVRGHAHLPSPPFATPPQTTGALLFPYDDAQPIAQLRDSEQPVTLVVPDGTWRQASKVRNRVPGLLQLPCVTLPPEGPSMYRLRNETHPGGLGTMEAIARALGVLEGAPVRDALDHVFCTWVERTLWSRGLLAPRDVTGGIPEGAIREYRGLD